MSQRLPSESLKFTKVWATVPPKCLKGCPLSHLGSPRFGPRYPKVFLRVPPTNLKGRPSSHLGSPRFGPRYHLSVSKVAPWLHTKRFAEGGGCNAPRNMSACLTFRLRHLANSSQDGFRTWQLTTQKKTSSPETQVPEPLCSHTCRICRGLRRDTMAVWQQDHVRDVVDRQLCYSCIKHGSKNDQNVEKKMSRL